MSSSEKLKFDRAMETFARELPDEYQVVFPTHSSNARKIAIAAAAVLLGFLGFVMTFPSEVRLEGPITLVTIAQLTCAALFGTSIAVVCILGNSEVFLTYEVLAIGQGSIVLVKKFILLKRVKWARFDVEDLKMIDFQNGFGAFRHVKLGMFAKNLPAKDIDDVRTAILAASDESQI